MVLHHFQHDAYEDGSFRSLRCICQASQGAHVRHRVDALEQKDLGGCSLAGLAVPTGPRWTRIWGERDSPQHGPACGPFPSYTRTVLLRTDALLEPVDCAGVWLAPHPPTLPCAFMGPPPPHCPEEAAGTPGLPHAEPRTSLIGHCVSPSHRPVLGRADSALRGPLFSGTPSAPHPRAFPGISPLPPHCVKT